jgi:DNA-binding NarL/FixJ family response regulator
MEAVNVIMIQPDGELRKRHCRCISEANDFDLVGAGGDLIGACSSNSPPRPVHVLVTNLNEGNCLHTGFWALIHGILPGTRVVGLVDGGGDLVVLWALAAGVFGLHRASVGREILCRAVRSAARWRFDYDPSLAEKAKRTLGGVLTASSVQGEGLSRKLYGDRLFAPGRHNNLTLRDREVLALVGRGLSNREIGKLLFLSERSVRNRVCLILDKLDLRNRTQLAVMAFGLGLIDVR